MMKVHKNYLHKIYIITLILLVFFLFIVGCDHQKSIQKPIAKKESIVERLKPLELKENQFEKVVGWLNNEKILYITQQNKEYLVKSYQLDNGDSEILFQSKDPVKNVIISPDYSKILVQTAPLTYLAKLFILDLNGKTIFSQEIESFDLAFDWNEINPQKIAISVFFEDWSYKINILDLDTFDISEHSYTDPFIKWFGNNTILLQEWSKNDIRLTAPLVSMSLNNPKNHQTLFKKIYQFDTSKQYLMTITVGSNNKEKAIYHFYNQSMEEEYTFQAPHLSQFNDWLVPYYDFKHKYKFLSFIPYESGSIDEYEKEYKLVSYDISRRDEKVIMEHLQNEPISCSPNGEICLYGFQFEKLLDLINKRVIPLVEFKENKKSS